MAEGLSILISKLVQRGRFKGIKIIPYYSITHLLFMDIVLIFYDGLYSHLYALEEILDLFYQAIRMLINSRKFSIIS